MKKYLLLLALVFPISETIGIPFFNNLKAQEIFSPSEHSDKWIDGNELYLKVIDSVKVKINYLATADDWWVFEVEFINLSTEKDVLIDPQSFRYDIPKTIDGKTCLVNSAFQFRTTPFLEGAVDIDLKKLLKKNTLEPNKSLYGLMVIRRCKKALNMQIQIPISGRTFQTVFERTR